MCKGKVFPGSAGPVLKFNHKKRVNINVSIVIYGTSEYVIKKIYATWTTEGADLTEHA